MKLIAFDPGKTTGWAVVEDMIPVSLGEVQYGPELFDFLEIPILGSVDVVVIENYRVIPPNAQKNRKSKFYHQWGELPQVRAIGAIEYWAHREKLPVEFQEPSVLKTALQLTGWKGKGHPPDKMSALAHGLHYFHKRIGRV